MSCFPKGKTVSPRLLRSQNPALGSGGGHIGKTRDVSHLDAAAIDVIGGGVEHHNITGRQLWDHTIIKIFITLIFDGNGNKAIILGACQRIWLPPTSHVLTIFRP
jgi:hypothetical protein